MPFCKDVPIIMDFAHLFGDKKAMTAAPAFSPPQRLAAVIVAAGGGNRMGHVARRVMAKPMVTALTARQDPDRTQTGPRQA